MLNRRSLLKAVAGTAAAAGFPTIIRAQARDRLAMMTPFGFIPDFIEMMNAISGGHFAAQGIDATLLGGQGTAVPIQQLIAGQTAFIRLGGVDVIRSVATTKVPIVAIASIYQASSFTMISAKEKPIKSAEELKGKTVGLVSVGGTTDVFLDLILSKGGLKKDDVKREITGNSPGAFQLVKQGRVDCFIASTQVVIALQRMKEEIETWSTDRYAPMPGQCYATSSAFAEKSPDLLKRAMLAMKASAEEMLRGPIKPIFERASKDFDIPGIKDIDGLAEVEKVIVEKLWLSEGRESLLRNVPRLWASGVNALNASGIAKIDNPETVYTNRFV
jgi:NitT/TauT family transport system substrate-binding protein